MPSHFGAATKVALFWIVFAWLFCNADPVKSEVITEDRGGQIGHYLNKYTLINYMREEVTINGNCLSACTLVLGVVPLERIHFGPKARLGFHAAWMPDADGLPVTNQLGTQALWNIYPQKIRGWITRTEA